MTKEQQIKNDLKRLAKIKRWAERIEKLINRKRNPLSESKFCEKYNLHKSHFNRTKNGHAFPEDKFFNDVQKAFKAERV